MNLKMNGLRWEGDNMTITYRRENFGESTLTMNPKTYVAIVEKHGDFTEYLRLFFGHGDKVEIVSMYGGI